MILSLFICPVCREALQRKASVYSCVAGHTYDIAAQGYVHLLPVRKMHAKVPGDTREMVAARRRFLDGGWYEPFQKELAGLLGEALRGNGHPVILDAGCGEGYYTGYYTQFLTQDGKNPVTAGVDISKFAVKAAAKRYPDIEFAVGSTFDLPVASVCADAVVSVFAPIVPGEFARVCKPGGSLILAVPGPRHLYGMKEILYEKPYENEEKDTAYDGFSFVGRFPVREQLRLTKQQDIMDLFSMTPYYWKTDTAGSLRLKTSPVLETEIHFDFLVYQRDFS